MKILWSVNILPPEPLKSRNLGFGHSISWVEAMGEKIVEADEYQLVIVAPGNRTIKEIYSFNYKGIRYYLLPSDCDKRDYWEEILTAERPEVIHIYGTEKRHNVNLIKKYNLDYPIIVSLQGIISEYQKYYYAGMKSRDILFNITFGDVLLGRSIWDGKRRFKKQSYVEQDMLTRIRNVDGRSDWDYVYSRSINNELIYHYCPRMIRKPFFNYVWRNENCEKHSILVSQGSYPIKGLHFALEALAILKEKYPNVKLYVAGKSNLTPKSMKEYILFTGYSKFIKKKISILGLENAVIFTGHMDAENMAKKLASVNVYLIPSSIENAPNSISEAMIVGTPCVASYVGGNPDMLEEGKCGLLYRYDEPEMLAFRIETIFGDENIARKKSKCARERAMEKHDPEKLLANQLKIYSDVIENHHMNVGG